MATYLGTGAVFEVRSGATAGNLGGGGFNPANTNFLTDGAATVATGNSPVFTSASYNFVAGDVGAWIYVKSGTNWTPGWYQIASVAANAATLSAAIGQASQIANNRYGTNTVAGCATTASPTGATWGIDYSQQNSAQFTNSVLTGTTTTCTDATNPFGVQMVGNFICISTGTGVTAGWYEIVSVSGVTATLDRTAGASYSACTYYLGGAVSLGGSTTGITDVIFFALGAGASTTGCRTFIKGGATYTPNAAVTTLSANANWPVTYEGYNSIRGDRPSIASGNQPIIACGANVFTVGLNNILTNLSFTGTASSLVNLASDGSCINYCKVKNSSTTASRNAIQMSANDNCIVFGCEVISYNGTGILMSSNGFANGNYIHDCTTGITFNANKIAVSNNIIASCKTQAIDASGATAEVYVIGNTLYGAENIKGTGVGSLPPSSIFINNIVYGFASGIGGAFTPYGGTIDYNCFFNNTSNIAAGSSGSFLGAHDLTATNPSFTSVAQVTGTTATSSGTTLTDSGKNFTTAGVVAGRDYLLVVSGTGATVGIYGITVVGTTTLTTDNTIGTSSGGNLVYQITTGRNFAVSLANTTGYPGTFPAGLTTGYDAIGAAQPAGGAGTTGSAFS